MDWDKLTLDHGRQFSKFMADKIADWSPTHDEEKYLAKWGARYKALVARHFYEAQDFIEREQRLKEAANKVHDVIKESAEAAAYVDIMCGRLHTLDLPTEEQVKRLERLDKYELTTDPELKERLRQDLVRDGILVEEKKTVEKVKDALDKILSKGKQKGR